MYTHAQVEISTPIARRAGHAAAAQRRDGDDRAGQARARRAWPGRLREAQRRYAAQADDLPVFAEEVAEATPSQGNRLVRVAGFDPHVVVAVVGKVSYSRAFSPADLIVVICNLHLVVGARNARPRFSVRGRRWCGTIALAVPLPTRSSQHFHL